MHRSRQLHICKMLNIESYVEFIFTLNVNLSTHMHCYVCKYTVDYSFLDTLVNNQTCKVQIP